MRDGSSPESLERSNRSHPDSENTQVSAVPEVLTGPSSGPEAGNSNELISPPSVEQSVDSSSSIESAPYDFENDPELSDDVRALLREVRDEAERSFDTFRDQWTLSPDSGDSTPALMPDVSSFETLSSGDMEADSLSESLTSMRELSGDDLAALFDESFDEEAHESARLDRLRELAEEVRQLSDDDLEREMERALVAHGFLEQEQPIGEATIFTIPLRDIAIREEKARRAADALLEDLPTEVRRSESSTRRSSEKAAPVTRSRAEAPPIPGTPERAAAGLPEYPEGAEPAAPEVGEASLDDAVYDLLEKAAAGELRSADLSALSERLAREPVPLELRAALEADASPEDVRTYLKAFVYQALRGEIFQTVQARHMFRMDDGSLKVHLASMSHDIKRMMKQIAPLREAFNASAQEQSGPEGTQVVDIEGGLERPIASDERVAYAMHRAGKALGRLKEWGASLVPRMKASLKETAAYKAAAERVAKNKAEFLVFVTTTREQMLEAYYAAAGRPSEAQRLLETADTVVTPGPGMQEGGETAEQRAARLKAEREASDAQDRFEFRMKKLREQREKDKKKRADALSIVQKLFGEFFPGDSAPAV